MLDKPPIGGPRPREGKKEKTNERGKKERRGQIRTEQSPITPRSRKEREKERKKMRERKKKGRRKAGSTGTEPNRTNHHRGEND